MSDPDWKMPRPGGRRALLGAFCAALVLEVAGIVAATAWIGSAPPSPAIEKAPLKVSLVTLPPAPPAPAPPPPDPAPQPPAPQPPPPDPTPPPPAPQPPPPDPTPPPPAPAPPPPEPPPPEPPPPPPPPKPVPRPQKPKPKPVRPVKEEQKPPPDHVAHVEPPDQPPPSAPAAPAAASPDEMARYQGQVRQAVQRTTVYPMAARESHQTGRAQIAFTVRGNRAEALTLVKSSGFPILDRAALAAVQDAQYPPPPAALAGRDMRFLVWVEFHRGDDDDDD